MKKYFYIPCQAIYIKDLEVKEITRFITLATSKALFPIIDATNKAKQLLDVENVILLNPVEISEEDYLNHPKAG